MKQLSKLLICLLLVGLLVGCSTDDFGSYISAGSVGEGMILPSTAATAAPSTQPVDRLPGLDEGYQDHILLKYRGEGSCTLLTGDVVLTFIMVDDPDSQWSAQDLSAWKAETEKATALLETAASGYDVPLDITVRYLQCTVSEPLVYEDYHNWACLALEALGYDPQNAAQSVLEEFRADSSAFLFCTEQDGRSFARHLSGDGLEYAVLYRETADYRHELLHLFGAHDYYYPSELTDIFNTYFEESVMLTSVSAVVDDLTAYTIGWTDTPSDKALSVLDDGAWLTYDYIIQARQAEVITGYGTKRYSNSFYEGDMVRGIPHGQGTLTWDSGEVYTGDFVDGKRTGKGTIKWPSGNMYTGDFVDGKRTGKGTFTWSNGDVYTGDFVEDERTGTGTFTWANGNTYTGDFVNSQRTGKGTFTWSNGDVYTGDYLEGKKHGQGTITWASGNVYTGDFTDDQRTGYGTFTWTNGDVYTGNFRDGLLHGQGTLTKSDGKVYAGQWQDNKFIG